MKKILLLITVLVLVISLSACTGASVNDPASCLGDDHCEKVGYVSTGSSSFSGYVDLEDYYTSKEVDVIVAEFELQLELLRAEIEALERIEIPERTVKIILIEPYPYDE